MALKGFAFVIGFFASAALLFALATSASLARDATFFEEKFSILELRKAVGWDIRHAWSTMKSTVSGDTIEERALDFTRKVGNFGKYLETAYPVKASLIPGLQNAQDLLKSALDGSPFDCPSCRYWPGVFTVVFYGSDWAAFEELV